MLDPPYISTVDSGNIAGHLIALRQACLALAARTSRSLRARLQAIADAAYEFVPQMEFGFLYDDERKLFTIGYHPESFTRGRLVLRSARVRGAPGQLHGYRPQ